MLHQDLPAHPFGRLAGTRGGRATGDDAARTMPNQMDSAAGFLEGALESFGEIPREEEIGTPGVPADPENDSEQNFLPDGDIGGRPPFAHT